jgi:hypothetical protein
MRYSGIRLLAFGTLVLVTTSSVAAPVTLPPDLNPGEPYRLVFVTSTTRDATSSNIGNYNAFVSSVAASVPELAALGTNWRAIASTASVDARDNTNTNPNTSTGVPIYNLAGLRVADNYADLWNGTLDAAILYDESGIQASQPVWTGSESDGTAHLGGLGDGSFAAFGLSFTTNFTWMFEESQTLGTSQRFYAISGLLPVPEPGTIAITCIAITALACGRIRTWRNKRSGQPRTTLG